MTGEDRLCTPGRRCAERGAESPPSAAPGRQASPASHSTRRAAAAAHGRHYIPGFRVLRVASRASNALRRVGDRFPDGDTETRRRHGSALADRQGDPAATVRTLTRISFASPTNLCDIPRLVVSSAVRFISAKPNGCARGRRYADHWT